MKTARINLLFIVNSLCVGGAEKHLVTLLNNLDRTRFRISAAYLKNDSAQLPQIDLQKLEGRVIGCDVSRRIDLPVVRRLAQLVNQESIEIIVCVNTYSLLYGWLARGASRRRPRVVDIFHTTDMNMLKDRLQMLFYRPFFGISNMLIYVCENQRRYWRARILRARNDVVIHNGIDVAYFSDHYSAEQKNRFRSGFGFPDTAYVVGLCAAMRPEKAHGDLLQAVAMLRGSGVDIKCLFIGDGPERPRIERQIEAMGLAGQVGITGYLADIRPAIAACDVMAMVSHMETFSIAVLEAMALGKPVVMSRIGGATEQVTHGANGYLYERGDIANLAKGLKLLMDANRRGSMGSQARTSVSERFSLSTMVAAYDRLFVELVRPRRLRAKAEAPDAA